MATSHSTSASKKHAQQAKNVVPITIRVTPEEKATFRKLAQAKGLSYGQLLMELVHEAENNTPALVLPSAPLPSELHKRSLRERNAILHKQAVSAAALYAANPELIADGSDDVNVY